jgi:DNA-directed RNA polymerase subunit beta'
LYGYGDPIAPKTAQRGVSGFLKQITGTSPKFSYFQRKLLSKTQDSVARGTISIDPELSLDEIGVPEDMAWTMYSPYIQRRLTRAGLSMRSSLENLRDRTEQAKRAMLQEMEERPIIYSRAPSWHKFNVVAGRPKLIGGSTIAVNPLITTGMNADFDGDAMNLHVPSQRDAVQEAWDVLMPSKMLFSIRDQSQVVPTLKHEQVLGLYTGNRRPSQNAHTFATEEEALKAIRTGAVKLSDDVEILDSK